MRLAWPRFLLCVFALCLATVVQAEVPVPPLAARVTDLTASLSTVQRDALESQLQGLEARSGSQLAVLLVATTQPESIEQYALRVAEAWKLGKKGSDHGLLLLVAKNDRKVRIELGYGLEGVIPDALARRVIDEAMTPLFKQGDFAGGLDAGVQRLALLIEGRDAASQSAPEEAAPAPVAKDNEGFFAAMTEMPNWLLVLLVLVGSALRWVLGPLFGGLAMGSIVGGGVWFISGSLAFALFAGLGAFVFVLVGIANWISIGASGSSGGSGGFSGGGGSFGGGGASGSW